MSIDTLFGLLALAGLVLSLLAHGAALLGVDVIALVPQVWALHIGVIALFYVFVMACRADLGPRTTFTAVRALFPHWVFVAGGALLSYAVLNFVVTIARMDNGRVTEEAGRYLFYGEGRAVRELTAAEYHAMQARFMRLFSGHWMVFYFLPCVYFLFTKQPRQQPD